MATVVIAGLHSNREQQKRETEKGIVAVEMYDFTRNGVKAVEGRTKEKTMRPS